MSVYTYTVTSDNDWAYTVTSDNDWKYTVTAEDDDYLLTKPGGYILTTKSGTKLKQK